MNPDKFALVSHVLPPSWSGQAVMIGRILHYLPVEQYCLIQTRNYQKVEHHNTDKLEVNIHHLPAEPGILRLRNATSGTHLSNWLQVFTRGIEIARIIKREGCRIILAATGDIIDLPAAWWASCLTGAKIIPYLFDDYLYQWPDAYQRSFAASAEKIIYRTIQQAIAPNEFMQAEIEKRRQVKCAIVRNPTAVPVRDEFVSLKHSYKHEEEINIVYTGAIYHVNFQAFHNLLAAIGQSELNIKLHLYTAQSIDWLQKNGIKSEAIVYHPHEVHEKTIGAQKNAHILFLPFSFNCPVPELIRTSAPGKLAEYLSSGVPILAHVPPESYVSWYFRKYNCGYVVDVNDTHYLHEALSHLIRDERLRTEISANAIKQAQLDFNPELAANSLWQVIKENS